MNYQIMGKYEGNLHAYYNVKEASMKRVHTLDFNYMIVWKGKTIETVKNQQLPRFQQKGEVEHKFFRAVKLV